MTSQVLLTMDDLETAVPLNAALEAAGVTTAMVSAMDDARQAIRRAQPELVILTGAVHEPPALQLASLARGRRLRLEQLRGGGWRHPFTVQARAHSRTRSRQRASPVARWSSSNRRAVPTGPWHQPR